MDNSNNNSEQEVMIRGKSKIFRYNIGIDSIVESNLAQMPFIAEYKGPRLTYTEYIWYSTGENGAVQKRGIAVSGHGKYGVPTLYDYEVLIAIQTIYIKQKAYGGFCELKTDNITDKDLKVKFTVTQVAREMGFGTPNKTMRDKIKKSIDILLGTTIKSIYEGGIYDVENKKYIVDTNATFHYLESSKNVKVQSLKAEEKKDKRVGDFYEMYISKFTYYQILNNYKLYYNNETFKSIKNKMSKKLYHIFLQWRHHRNHACFSAHSVRERVPMIERDEKYKKRYFKRALKVLNDSKALGIKYDAKNDKIWCDYKDTKNKNELLNKYNKYSEIQNFLYSIGFTIIDVQEYVDIEQIEQIKALLRYIDDTGIKDYPNIKQYVMKSLKNPKKLDKKYYDKSYLKAKGE